MSRKRTDPAIPSVGGFWDFIALRQEAYWLKQEGKPSWNDMMASNHWPNVFRELDKGTIYFQNQVKSRTDTEVIVSSVIYRLLNRQGTFEALGGIPTLGHLDNFSVSLAEYREAGNPVFTYRHLTPSWANYMKALTFLKSFMGSFAEEIWTADSLKEAWGRVRQVPGTGGFLAWQICCDLLESKVLKFSENDWVYVGPGPRNAFQLLLDVESVTQAQCFHRLNWLRERQKIFLEQGSIPFQFPPNVSELTLKNLEHAMCEYYRWVAAHWKKQS